MFTKKVLSLLLAAVLVLSLAACGQKIVETNPTETKPVETEPTETKPVETKPTETAPDSPLSYFSLSYGENLDAVGMISVYPNEDGTVHVEYTGQVRKVTDLDASALDSIVESFYRTGLVALNGQSVYSDGDATASMYVSFEDGTGLYCDFGGEVPEAFTSGFAAMDQFFQDLLKDVAEYVPEPLVMGEVDAVLLEELKNILDAGEFANLDGYTITGIPMDEYFGFTAGLTDATGVMAAAQLAPMMMTSAYSLVVVSLENEADADKISQDFLSHLDWSKWVCVAPSDAMTAKKGNLVLCAMTPQVTLTQTKNGLDANGWEIVTTLQNPDLQ